MFTLTLGIVLFCCAAALVAGFVDSIAGGGGLLTVPALLLAGVPPHLALGTNKMQSSCGTAAALLVFARGSYVLWQLALVALPFSLVGAALGSKLALVLDEAVLGKLLVIMLPIAMVFTLLPKKEREGGEDPVQGRTFGILLPVLSLTIGMYDGFFGPGTGSFLILGFHWVLRVGLVQASATAKVLNLGSNVGAMCVFLLNGQVIWGLALPMVVASVCGNYLGSRLAIRLGPRAVRLFLTVSLGLLLATLLYRTFLAN